MGTALALVVFTRTIGGILVISVFAYLVLAGGTRFWRELVLAAVAMAAFVGLVLGLTPVTQSSLVPRKYLEAPHASFLMAIGAAAGSEDARDRLSSRYGVEADTPVDGGRFDVGALWGDFLGGVRYHVARDVRSTVLPLGGGPREQSFAQRIGVSSLPLVVGLAVSGLIALGYIRWLAQERVTALNFFGLLYAGALAFWAWSGARLLYPIVPQLIYALLLGTEGVLSATVLLQRRNPYSERLRRWVLVSTVLALAITYAYVAFLIGDSRLHVGDLEARTHWIRANSASSATVMTELPEVDYLYGERKTVPYPPSSMGGDLARYLEQRAVDYVLVAPELRWQSEYVPAHSERAIQMLGPLSDLADANRVTLVYSSEGDLVQVFEVERER
jgi:hypothetical protein